jgi:transcriptional regulator GlxA family with amidase domain
MSTYTIGIPIVEKFDLMDVANPYEVFSWMKPFWRAAGTELQVLLIGHAKGAQVQAFNGASLTTQACFADFNEARLDLIFVPGGGSDYIEGIRRDRKLLEFVGTQAKHAKLVASVCTGAFVLAEAGVLEGLRATTHWMFQEELQQRYPNVQVVNGYPRFVTDGKVMTGGGISSGIDASLSLAGAIAGEQVGRDIELAIQYHPQPPYGTGDPAVADYTTWKQVTTDLKG